MTARFLNIQHQLPRWGILLIDTGICIFSVLAAYLLRFDFDISERYMQQLIVVLPWVVGIRLVTFLLFKTYAGIIKHTSTEDGLRIGLTIATGSILFLFANFFWFAYKETYILPTSIIIIDFILTLLLMIAFRLMVKMAYLELKTFRKEKKRVAIFGAGEPGIITKKTLERDEATNYKVVGFIDTHPELSGKRMEGLPIYPLRRGLMQLLVARRADLVIISDPEISKSLKQRVVNLCLRYDINVWSVPAMTKWINGQLSLKQIKEVRIEDLLGREPIHLENKDVEKQLRGKVILVTGAAGSIGSELVRQILVVRPQKIILLDKAETPLYELERELEHELGQVAHEVVVGDITHAGRMQQLFETHRPNAVYHAAAYKHVPLMEKHPAEAIHTNVYGTQVLADLAVSCKADKFVFVSTDKAVNPTNVMGCSKRIAEIYVQSLGKHVAAKNGKHNTRFITTRFGNVLGSNGSVIQLFRKQIRNGGPVTVTHPKVTRFFMTISEACQLVLEAGTMGKGGEIYIFDMGEPVRIMDLAQKMIKLSGLELGRDIQIIYAGLRPGEKLYEELLNDEENTLKTHHRKIMIAQVREYDYQAIQQDIQKLIKTASKDKNLQVVRCMKALVPEYISQNSEYHQLDEVQAS